MDTRILEKLDSLKASQREKEESDKKAKLESHLAHKKYIQSKLPEARTWVSERLLDIIAKESLKKNGKYSLQLKYCDKQDPHSFNIPEEAKAIAAGEVDGLLIKKVWVPESQNPNDESGNTWDEAHYTYYVEWMI